MQAKFKLTLSQLGCLAASSLEHEMSSDVLLEANAVSSRCLASDDALPSAASSLVNNISLSSTLNPSRVHAHDGHKDHQLLPHSSAQEDDFSAQVRTVEASDSAQPPHSRDDASLGADSSLAYNKYLRSILNSSYAACKASNGG